MTWTNVDCELLDRIGEVLFYIWDPIGIGGSVAAREEYDVYRDEVFSILVRGGREQEIVEYFERDAVQLGLIARQD